MTNTLCTVCIARPADGMCHYCWTKLKDDLLAVGDTLGELDVTVTKQAKVGGGGIGFVTGNPETAMPIHLGAAQAEAELREKLSLWVLDLWEFHAPRWHVCLGCGASTEHGDPQVHKQADDELYQTCRGSWETRTDRLDITIHAVPLARWMLRHPTWVRSHKAALELHDEITSAMKHARRIVSGPGERVYLGRCSPSFADPDSAVPDADNMCAQPLYGLKNRDRVVCPACGWDWDMAERRNWLLWHMEDQQLTATETSRALTSYLDKPLTPEMVRGYAHRGRISPVGYRKIGLTKVTPMYRVGDVLTVLFPVVAAEEAIAS